VTAAVRSQLTPAAGWNTAPEVVRRERNAEWAEAAQQNRADEENHCVHLPGHRIA
jgi:hypothetical protein